MYGDHTFDMEAHLSYTVC